MVLSALARSSALNFEKAISIDGWMAPAPGVTLPHSGGISLNVYQIHGVDAKGRVLVRRPHDCR